MTWYTVHFRRSASVFRVLVSGVVLASTLAFSLAPTGVASAASGGSWIDLTGNGVFQHPTSVAVDSAGDVFVVNDVANNSAQVSANVVEELPHGTTNWIDITNGHSFNVWFGGRIAVDAQGDVFVTDFENNQVDELSPVNGSYVSSTWTNIGSFQTPYGIAIGGNGNVYVLNNTKFGPILEERVNGVWTTLASNADNLAWPQGLAVDSAGDAFMGTAFNSPGYLFELPAGATGYSYQNIPGAPGTVTGASFDPNGNLYVAGSTADIWELSPSNGNYANGTWTQITNPLFNVATDIAFDSRGDMFVVNTGNTTKDAVIEYLAVQPTPPLRFLSITGATSNNDPTPGAVLNPTGTVGQFFFDVLHSAGGSGYALWSLKSGQLPPGLTVKPSGAIIGIPTKSGSFTFTVLGTDHLSGATTTSVVTVTINSAP